MNSTGTSLGFYLPQIEQELKYSVLKSVMLIFVKLLLALSIFKLNNFLTHVFHFDICVHNFKALRKQN